MNRGLSTLIACSALLVATSCGSSGGSSASNSGGTTSVTANGGVKAITPPRYAVPPSSAPVQSGIVQVAYRNIAIAPDTLRVKVGTTIRWTNYDSVEHNVTSESGPEQFASGTFGEGGTFQITATKPGVIHYRCTIHPATMNGTIEVVR